MKRISLILAAALASLLLVSVSTAGAMPTEENFHMTCRTASDNVIGNKINAKLVGKNVAGSQQQYGTCGYAKKVIHRITALGIEMPKSVMGYRCTPRVLKTEPDVVKYNCLFRGADTATEIRLRFKVAYAMPSKEGENFRTTCRTTSRNVIGKKITATVVGRNVARSQRRFGKCAVVGKVVRRMTGLRIEMPKTFEGYRCTPRVLKTEPDVVKYSCLFRGADTATEIRTRFKVTYNMD